MPSHYESLSVAFYLLHHLRKCKFCHNDDFVSACAICDVSNVGQTERHAGEATHLPEALCVSKHWTFYVSEFVQIIGI
jgi:hypothetical protein